MQSKPFVSHQSMSSPVAIQTVSDPLGVVYRETTLPSEDGGRYNNDVIETETETHPADNRNSSSAVVTLPREQVLQLTMLKGDNSDRFDTNDNDNDNNNTHPCTLSLHPQTTAMTESTTETPGSDPSSVTLATEQVLRLTMIDPQTSTGTLESFEHQTTYSSSANNNPANNTTTNTNANSNTSSPKSGKKKNKHRKSSKTSCKESKEMDKKTQKGRQERKGFGRCGGSGRDPKLRRRRTRWFGSQTETRRRGRLPPQTTDRHRRRQEKEIAESHHEETSEVRETKERCCC